MSGTKIRPGLTQKQTEFLSSLWHRIRNMGIMVEFDNFDDFCGWAVSSGFQEGKILVRKSKAGPFSEDNLFWAQRQQPGETDDERAARWDAFVNPIREQHNKTLERLQEEKRQAAKVTVWRYEHPDLVREGIVFESSCSV